MDEPQLLAVLIVIAFFFITLFGGGYLIYRTMNRPNSYIGARMHAEEQRRLQEEQNGSTGPASPADPEDQRGVTGPRGPEDQSPER
ncbi:hypothetical protein M3C63_03030 [Brevibacterium luteolum]|uniref:hypothetical protein n=1 Tax=Brevibacterium luteolum TaxID=199591 RepID=UPI00223B4807|nr:hypothetical protein [Brevibacterium luteolum]MCT1920839.1 hypothetical protein [Brevibacterium luteolum]